MQQLLFSFWDKVLQKYLKSCSPKMILAHSSNLFSSILNEISNEKNVTVHFLHEKYVDENILKITFS